jgi:hypothetical protein
MVQPVEHRREQLMRRGERKLHLRLDTDGACEPEARRVRDEVLQQRRLAHPRLAKYHERPALPCADGLEQPVEHLAFAAPAA